MIHFSASANFAVAMWSENFIPKSSTFASIFSRKKRINNTKAPDDMKGTAAELINGTQTVPNGFIDSDMDSLKELQSSMGPCTQNRVTDLTNHSFTRTLPNAADKTRSNKELRSNKYGRQSRGARSESVPLQISSLPDRTNKPDLHQNTGVQQKSQSANAVYMTLKDPGYLMEALETLAAEQPIVARSIPKHAVVDTSHFAQHSLDNCLFDASVYENMLDNSIKTCQLLQDHLNDCVAYVRARSPNGTGTLTSAPSHTDEVDAISETSDENGSQQTVVISPKLGHQRLSQLTSETSGSSYDSGIYAPDATLTTRLKSTVQYQC